jgi:hypothetical protein
MNLALRKENEQCEVIEYKKIPHIEHRLKIERLLLKIIDVIKEEIKTHDEDKLHDFIDGNNLRLKNQAIFLHKITSNHHVNCNPESTIIDDIVMLADWCSYWDLEKPKDEILRKFNYHCKKEEITPEIKKKLKNTLEKYFLKQERVNE